MYTYKDGYREGVAFVFYKNGKVLIENRVVGNKIEVFYPSGSIEEIDYYNKDYKLNALFREVNEEFENKVNIESYNYLTDILVKDINVIFYVFIIDKWTGEIPQYTVEDGKKHSEITFIDINDSKKYFEFTSALEITDKVKEYVKKNQL